MGQDTRSHFKNAFPGIFESAPSSAGAPPLPSLASHRLPRAAWSPGTPSGRTLELISSIFEMSSSVLSH